MGKINLNKVRKVFAIGIGGAGVSAAVQLLAASGKKVSGSDSAKNEITARLIQEGVAVKYSQPASEITKKIDLVVYSVAVPASHPQRRAARQFGIPELSYPELLGLLMKGKYSIGISGTNGKTTTTGMIGKILFEADWDPTIVVGGKLHFLKNNFRLGKSEYFVFESDEYRRAFDNYSPRTAVVTQIVGDHFDYFRDLREITAAFRDYLCRVPKSGLIVVNGDDKNCRRAVEGVQATVATFSPTNRPADYQAREVLIQDGGQKFLVFRKGKRLGEIFLPLPAEYNLANALAAVALADRLGLDFRVIKRSLKDFQGAARRLEKLGRINRTEIIADYAHTPDAVAKTIAALKKTYPKKRLLAVFQPHQLNRTKKLFSKFAQAFNQADRAIISDIFFVPGRENPEDFAVNSKELAEAAKSRGAAVEYGGNLEKTETIIEKSFLDFDLVAIIGAGNIYQLARKLVSKKGRPVSDRLVEEKELSKEKLNKLYRKPRPKESTPGFSQEKELLEQKKYYQTRKKTYLKIKRRKK